MRLPQNILTNTYTKPRIFLCEADKTKICRLETTNTSGTFKFNAYSELSFEVARVYNDLISGATKVNPYYDKIEALRLIYLEDFGYFEIQTPELSSDGIKEAKNITAYSSEYALSQKYLEKFYVNTGEIDSIEVLWAQETYGKADKETVSPVVFYIPDDWKNDDNRGLSLLDLVLKKAYGWTIGHVDASLMTLSRTFSIDRQSVYDFLMNEVCKQFNCYIVFDTETNTINFYAETLTQKFTGDGSKKTFTLSHKLASIGSVSVDGLKKTKYDYDSHTGKLTLTEPPASGAIIEVNGDGFEDWETDVFVTFDNLSQEIKVTYDADDIKTQLTVTGADGLGIREVNMGMPYLTDLSYYYTPDWLGQDLYDAYAHYLDDYNEQQGEYDENAAKIQEANRKIAWEQNRMSTKDSCIVTPQVNVTESTSGKYFIREGTAPNYYYKEVTLPAEYNASKTYYKFTDGSLNINETRVHNLYLALQALFQTYFNEGKINLDATIASSYSLNQLTDSFTFVTGDRATYSSMLTSLRSIDTFLSPSTMAEKTAEGMKYKIESTVDTDFPFACINRFLNSMWNELGLFPLQFLYHATYEQLRSVAVEAGWGDASSKQYGQYFAVLLMVQSLNRAIAARKKEIEKQRAIIAPYQSDNNRIAESLDLYNYFKSKYSHKCEQFMMRMSAFLREDEYSDDNFVYTGQESAEELLALQRELKECGKIELSKLSQPKLQFSMSMANIYALPEFAPIINQFQLGRVIKVALRSDYLKQSRLLQVNINFDDFSDFSCEFGDLTNLKTQSDIHADLLSQAISAGKSVASNKSYWNKGSDTANEIDQRIQRGLLDAATSIKSMDGTQGVEIDNYGIHLRKENEDGTFDPEEGWITNNKFLYSSDNFQTVQSVYGKYTIDGVDYYGVLAKAVIAGYIQGSRIEGGDIIGGTINIGNGAFVVKENGDVTMGGGNTIEGYYNKGEVDGIITDVNGNIFNLKNQVDDINASKMYRLEIFTEDSQIIKDKTQTATLKCKLYSWDEDVTDQVLGSAYGPDWENVPYVNCIRWKRKSNKTTGKGGDEEWNQNSDGTYKHTGKELVVTAEDIAHNASFYCEVELPERVKEEKTTKTT